MNKVDILEKTVKGGLARPKRNVEHTANLREWEGKLVVGNNGSPMVLNERTMEKEQMINLLVVNKIGDEPEEIQVHLLDYLNESLRVKVKILSQKAKETEKIQGTVNTSPTDEVYYRQHNINFSSEEVELVVTTIEYTSKIEVLEGNFMGETLEIKNKFLND
jgi:hypothetical protein